MAPPLTAKRKFTQGEVNTSLAKNIKRYKKDEPDDDGWEVVEEAQPEASDDLDGWTVEEEPIKPLAVKPEEKGFLGKALDFIGEPLSGGYFGREIRKYTSEAPREDIKATGKGDFQDWMAWSEAVAKGAKRGIYEGAGDFVDQLTAPGELAATLLGGGALSASRRGLSTVANLARTGSRIASGGVAAHGARGVKESGERLVAADNGWDMAKEAANLGFSLAELGGGAAGTTKFDLPGRRAPQPKIGDILPTAVGDQIVVGIGPKGKPITKMIPKEPSLQLNHPRPGADVELTLRNIDEAPPPVKSDGPTQLDDAPDVPEPTQPIAEQPKTEIEKMMAKRTTPSKRKLNLGVQEAPLKKEDVSGLKFSDSKTPFDVAKAELDARRAMGQVEDYEWELENLMEDFGQPSLGQRIRNFAGDEKGEIDIGALFDRYQRRKARKLQESQSVDDATSNPSIDDLSEAELGISRNIPHGDEINVGELPMGEIDLNQAAVDAGSDLARRVRPQSATGESFSQRLLGTALDETGSVPRRPKTENVWANLPDRVKAVFQENGITQKDIEGYSLKDVNDTYDNFVNQMAGIESEPAANVPLKRSQNDPVDISNLKLADTPKLVKKGGQRAAPIDENTRIQQLTDEAMKAVERERRIRLDAGETEMSPDELLQIQEQMQSGKPYVEPTPEPTPEPTMRELGEKYNRTPLLRSKDYFKKFMKNEKGEIDFSALMPGDEIAPGTSEFGPDLMQQNEQILGGESPVFEPRQGTAIPPETSAAAPSLMDRFKNFMGDETGEINLGERQPQRLEPLAGKPQPRIGGGPKNMLMDESQLQQGLPVQERTPKALVEPGALRQGWDLAQGLMSVDLPYLTSAAFRQASPLAWTDGWFRSWAKAAQAFNSEALYKTLDDEIRSSKYFKPRYKPSYDVKGNIKGYKEMPSIAEEMGVRMSDFKHIVDREEHLRSALAEKIPGWGSYVKKSNRAYAAFLNNLRRTKFEELMDQRAWSGTENDVTVGKQIAEFVNDATGRSSLRTSIGGKKIDFEKNAQGLAAVLWSPRLLASRIKFLNPATYASVDPMVRKEYLNGLFRTMGTWSAFAGLASMMGAQVGLDRNSADFGKIKIGNTRIDPGAGFQQLLVFGSRMASGQFTSSSTGKTSTMGEGFKPRTRYSTAEEFAASKLHPSAKLALDLLKASGTNPVHLDDRLVQMVLPMVAQDVVEVMKEDPELAAILAPLSSVGMGTANYGKGDFNKPVFVDNAPEEFLGLPEGSFTVGGSKRRR